MAWYLSPFKVQVFVPELPKPEAEHIYYCLQAYNGPDAAKRALKKVFSRTGHVLGKKPRRFVLIVEYQGDDA